MCSALVKARSLSEFTGGRGGGPAGISHILIWFMHCSIITGNARAISAHWPGAMKTSGGRRTAAAVLPSVIWKNTPENVAGRSLSQAAW